MQILVEIGNDDFFGTSDLSKMGFIAAALESQLGQVVDKPEIYLTGITFNTITGKKEILRFSPGRSNGVEIHEIPAYLEFLKKLEEMN